jgi:RHS repeat-associated protein
VGAPGQASSTHKSLGRHLAARAAKVPALPGTLLVLLATASLLMAAPAASAETYREAVEGTAGISHFWPMGEASGSSFTDVVGGDDAEVSSGGVTLGEPGGLAEESATSVLFDGSSSAAQASVDLSGTHELTVELWMKWNTYGSDDHLALELTPNFNDYTGGFLVDPDATPGSDFAVSIGKGSTANTVFFARPSAGEWHYYAFVIDTEAAAESEITPYVDGHAVSYTKSASGTGAGNFADSTLFWMSRDASTLFGAGYMQDLALYDTTLSAGTISEHYDLGQGGPRASFTSTPVAATAGVPVRVDASGSSSPAGSITNYAWDFDGGKGYGTSSGSSPMVSHTFSSPGTYTVDLRVTDGTSATATVSHTVTVSAALGAYAQAVEKTSGLAHYWPMGESSGSLFADVFAGADATLDAGVTLGEPGGLVGDSSTSAAFDGSTGAAQADVDLSGTHELTVEFWMKWNTYGSDDHLALEFTPNFNDYTGGFLVDPDATPGSDFAASIGRGSSVNTVFFKRPSTGEWHYYAFVINSEAAAESEITPYVDGHAVSYTKSESGTGAGNFADSTLFWMSRDADTLFGAGSMQDLALYETTLSSSAILEHYEIGHDESPCTDTWTGPSEGNWETAGNWSTGSVPDTSDIACVGSGVTVQVAGGTDHAGVLLDEGALDIPSGSLELASESRSSTVGALTLNGGTLTGAGTLDVSGSLSWSYGTMSGSGSTVIEPDATATLKGGTQLTTRQLDNEGTATLTNGTFLNMSEGAQIKNSGTFKTNTTEGWDGFQYNPDTGPAPSIINTGTFEKTAGSAETEVKVSFENQGTVQSHAGSLQFYGGGTSTDGTWSASEGGSFYFGEGTYTLEDDTLAGPVSLAGATITTKEVKAGITSLQISGGTLNIATGSLTTTDTTQTYGTLTGTGTLDISGSLSWTGGTMSGSGATVIEPGASATLKGGTQLTTRQLDNEGTATLTNGTFLNMSEGAQIKNSGTFKTNTTEGWDGFQYNPDTGPAPSIINTGTFEKTAGSAETEIKVDFTNDGHVTALAGELKFFGGVPEQAAYGSWHDAGGAIVFVSGTFTILEDTDLSGVGIESAKIIWVPRNLRGSLGTLPPYVSGIVSVTGSGEGGLGGALTGVSVEVAPEGGTWATLCGSLTPGLAGEFECSWDTAGGGYTDGRYQLRATLSGGSSPPETLTTSVVSVSVDNTPPTGSVVTPPSGGVGGSPTMTGTASDSGSGVQSWQLQIAPEGSTEWESACASQSVPLSGDEYGCVLETADWAGGAYELRALISDRAGNTHLTSTVGLHIDNATLGGSLDEVPSFVAKTVEVEGAATSTGAGIASWALQIAPAGTSSWSSACAVQSAPLSGSTYGCSLDTTALTDGTYQLRALITDEEGNTRTTAAASTVVDNTPPSGSLSPLPGSISGSFEVQGYAEDAGTGVASWTLQLAPAGSETWSEPCLPQTLPVFGDVYGCSVDTSDLENGEYQLRAVIADNAGNTYTTPTASVTVQNTPPSSTAAPVVSGITIAGRTLSATTGSWEGPAVITYAYQWQRCNSVGEACANVEGATGSTYTLGSGDVGSTLRVLVTASNGAGESSAASTASAVIAADTLANLSDPTLSGSPHAGATLNADPGEWSGALPMTFGYQWRLCNESGADCANITGATSASYTLSEADISSTLRVVVTASDSEGSLSETSAASAPITAGFGSGIRYLYDQAGRLSIVDDPSKGAAAYQWDADGNLLSIERYSHSTLAVLALTPEHAPAGATVDITGTGFDPDAADDEVSFDGTSATVSEASATDLFVIVPEGASTGHVTVTVSGESASSKDDFAPNTRLLGGAPKRLGLGRAPVAPAANTRAQRAASLPAQAPTTSDTASSASTSEGAGITGIPAAISDYTPRQPAAWDPTAANRRDDDWLSGRGPSPWATLPALAQHGAATTGLSGQALVVNGMPLASVTLSLQGTNRSTRTDRTGRFLLSGLPAGHQVLIIDGESADRGRERYGQYSVGVELVKGRTTPLGYTIWMTPLDPAGDARIQSPVKHETTLTNPRIPGLEVRLPTGTIVRSASGAIVHRLNLTAIPLDRPPFPLPPFISGIPTYFTVQPGRAYLSKGAQIIYPNWGHLPPGQRVDFWNYDPSDKGWYIYGKGSVSANGRQVIPDPDVRVWEFTGAMISSSGEPALSGPVSGASTNAGDPVDLATGLFVYQHTDLAVSDSLMPIALTRTYRQNESTSYSFGIGTASAFDIHLWSDENYKTAYLVLPNGGKVKLLRTSSGTGYVEAEYKTVETPGPWEGATMTWDETTKQWFLRRRDGMNFIFGELAPLQAIEDRNGNRITLVREGSPNGPITQIDAPHGHWIDLSYDSYNRITQAVDNAGQTVKYEYDSEGRLIKVTDPLGRVTRYTYDAAGDMTTVTDARGNALISNIYSRGGWVEKQTIGGVGTYSFSYTDEYIPGCEGLTVCFTNPSTTVRTPTGTEREVFFGAEKLNELPGVPLWEISGDRYSPGEGRRSEERRTYVRNFNEVIGEVDGNITEVEEEGLTWNNEDGHRTDEHRSSTTTKLAYDELGNVTSIKREAPSQSPLTTSFTYNGFSEPTSETNPQGRTTKYSYDTDGNLTAVTDPMGHQSTFGYDSEGELTSATDPEGHTSHFAYEYGQQVKNTDPLGHETQIVYNGVGLPTSVTNPEGQTTELTYDQDNELTTETDPAGDKTSYEYDADGNLTSVTDPRGHTQTATYNTLDKLASWTDALDHTTSYGYDETGRLTSVTDPMGQITSYAYGPFGELASASFGATKETAATSSIAYGYDAEGNLTSAVDSRGGTYTMSYGPYHRLTGETGPNGSVGYAYNPDGQRTSMSVNSETAASYSYNEDGQLTGIETPNGDVSFAYDPDGRRTQTTLPDADTENYSYDGASQLSGIDYEKPSGAQIGDLQYTRDALGRVSALSGSLARTNLPEALGETTYNAANELTSLEGHTLTYDADGNLTGDATSSYTYNDRNQLTGLTQGSNTWSFAYDPFGRRSSKTINSTTTSYLYDGENAVSETTGDSTAQLLNGLGLDERFARTTSTATSSYLTDELHSTIALANASGEPTTEYTYSPFGESTTSGTTSSNPYQYTGVENDGTGLLYNHARYYNPTTASFTSQDPTGLAGSGINLYQYTGSDPLNYIDPLGLESFWEEAGNAITGVGDAASGGLTIHIRSALGIGQPDFSSSAYQGGMDGGILIATLTGDEDAAAADLAEDAADEAPTVLRHYTTFDHAADIEADGLIKPSGDGYTYLTPDSYDDGLTAQQRLALKGTPDGYFEIPFDNPPASSTVSPANGQPGGGQESPVAGGVPLPSGGSFIPFG